MQAGLLYNLFESDKLGQSSLDWPFLYIFIESEVKKLGFFDGFGIGEALGIAGDLFGTSSALDAQDSMLEKQMAFNREVMQNRHQWEVADLKAAGLNPLMSVTSPTGTLSAPTPANVARMNLAQSAMAMSQASMNEKLGQAAITNANANMIKAENDTNRTQFMMGPEFELKTSITNAQMDNLIASTNLAHSQEALNVLQKEWIPKLMEADLNEKQMRIATGYLVAQAQDYHLRTTADASMVSANAHVMQAQSYDRFVANAEMLGVSQRYLNSQEAKVAEEKAKNIIQDTEAKSRINAAENELFSDPEFREMRQAGRTFSEFTGGSSLGSFVPW